MVNETAGGQIVARGSNSLRRWQIVRGAGRVRLHLWTPWFERLLVVAALAAFSAPLPALWRRALAAPRIATSVAATITTLLVVYVAVWALRRTARESVTVTAAEIAVEGPAVFGRNAERLRPEGGVEVYCAGGPLLELRLALGIETSGRYVPFGALLTRHEAERLREHLRAAVDARAPELGVADGLVRRVSARRGSGVPQGAEHLLVHERRKPWVVHGVLRMEHGVRGVGEVVFLAALFGALVWVVVSGYESTAAHVALLALIGAGIVLGRGGVLDRVRRSRSARRMRRSPREPWRAVDVWRDGVVRRSPLLRASGDLVVALVPLAVVVFIVLAPPSPPTTGQSIAIALFGLMALAAVVRVQNLIFQGTTEVHVDKVPILIPGEVVLGFAVSRRGAAFDTIQFTLQRVVEVHPPLRSPVVGSTHLGTYVPAAEHAVLEPGGQIEARFTVPEGAGGTCLDAGAPVWWELRVEGRTSCGWYAESFPVPLYDREVPAEG